MLMLEIFILSLGRVTGESSSPVNRIISAIPRPRILSLHNRPQSQIVQYRPAQNLLPVGQLDGGHMARAMFGRRVGETISSVAMWSLFLLAIFVWPGLLFWAILVFFIAGRGTPPLDDITPISTTRQWVGYGTFLILALILVPLPQAFWDTAGIYCPCL